MQKKILKKKLLLFYFRPVETIIGAAVGGIVGLTVLCVVIAVVCYFCCKKRTTGTVIQPHGVSTMPSKGNFRFNSFIYVYQTFTLNKYIIITVFFLLFNIDISLFFRIQFFKNAHIILHLIKY